MLDAKQDNLRRIALNGIKRHTEWLMTSSQEILHYVQMLEFRRPYTTDVEAAMEEAKIALVEARGRLTKARKRYKSLKKES